MRSNLDSPRIIRLGERVAAALLVLLCQVGVLQAAGLGGIKVLSRLGQPFAAEIDLINVSKDDLSTLNASLAAPSAYHAANLSFDPVLNALRLSVERRANGTPYIRATAARRVTEPYLDLLVEITSRDGRIQRQYTTLLDLPDLAESASQAAAPVTTTSAPAAAPKPEAAPARPQRAAPTPPVAQSAPTAIAAAPAVVAQAPAAPAIPVTRPPAPAATTGINAVVQPASRTGEPAKSDAVKAETPKAAPAKVEPAPVEAPKAELPKTEPQPESKPPAPVEPPQAPVPAAKNEITPPAKSQQKPQPTQGLFDVLMSNVAWIAGATLALLLALVGLFALRRRRQESAGASALAAPAEPTFDAPASVDGTSGAVIASQADDASAVTVAQVADTVDAIDEAKVYLEYGQDEPAEKLLREALSKQPGREDLQMLLLEILAGRGDKEGFNQLAGRLHKQTGGMGANWKRAMAMGYGLDPDYPLYSPVDGASTADPVAAPVAPVPVVASPDIELETPAPDRLNTTAEMLLHSGDEDTSMGKTMVMDKTMVMMPTEAEAPLSPQPAPVVEALPDLQFELPTISAPVSNEVSATASAEPAAKKESDLDTGLDFNIDFDTLKPVATQSPAAPVTETPAPSVTAVPTTAPVELDAAQLEEVQQKIDLTRAYLEMGDKEAALELLREIEVEGSASQQAEAREILSTLDS